MKRDLFRTIQDFRDLDWNDITLSSGTPGMLMKTMRAKTYYKLSCFDSYEGFYGHESVNELIVSRFLDVLGIPHVSYKLIHAQISVDGKEYETWMCSSQNYRKAGENKLTLETYYDLKKQCNESPLDFCIRMGWGRDVSLMMLADFLVGNKDRHGANIEVLQNAKGEARIAPLFDFGLSLLFSRNGENVGNVADYDVMSDPYANNYLGTRSLFKNLSLMPEKIRIPERTDAAKAQIMRGLSGILPETHLDKVWEFISKRWDYYAEFYHCE